PRAALAPAGASSGRHWSLRIWQPGDARQAAVYRFVITTLARSRRHSLIVGAWLGIAVALVLAGVAGLGWDFRGTSIAQVDAVVLAAPLVLCFFLAVGLRHVFALPAEPRASWLFRLSETEPAPQRLLAARNVLIGHAVLPPLAMAGLLALRFWGWRVALLHVAFSAGLMLLLAQAMLYRFRKLPFTCAYVPGRANLKVWWSAYWLMFTIFAYGSAALERRLWASPELLLALSAAGLVLAAAAAAAHRRWRSALAACQFEDVPEVPVQALFAAGQD
ncbi:MAG: hypothetical protein ACRD1E_00185, partial [Terriglobales bacterium]